MRVDRLAEALYDAEGRCREPYGQSGEYGCYQYLPGTWRAYSTLVADEVLPQTQENELRVTRGMLRNWIDEGKSDRWVFLQWNQGNGDGWGPGTKDCYDGWNDAGVWYDSCAYAARGLAALAAME